MKSWQKAWRALVDKLSTPELKALERALVDNDPRLIQGATTLPPPLEAVGNWPCEGACLLGYMGWQGKNHCRQIRDVERYFVWRCQMIDHALGEPAACKYLLNWWDETPREQAFAGLLEEVELALQQRQ